MTFTKENSDCKDNRKGNCNCTGSDSCNDGCDNACNDSGDQGCDNACNDSGDHACNNDSSQNSGADTERIVAELPLFADFLSGLRSADECDASAAVEGAEPCDLQIFALLLSGISSCRKVPGIEGPVGFDRLYRCEAEADKALAKEHLRRMYGVIDAESLQKVCNRMFHSGGEYAQFLSFWNGVPDFDESELDDYGKEAFGSCKRYAENFRPFVEMRGFFAWDCNEQIGLCRNAVACGIITEEEFGRICVPIAKRMAAIYSSWEEYAMSCLCGAVYFMFCESDRDDAGLYGFFDINRNILTHLLSENGPWRKNKWFRPVEKKWAINVADIKPLLKGWEDAEGCLATDRILVDGCKVGYMYREEPSGEMPDSGWRFFEGSESDEYTNNTDNVGIYHLNTLCNYDPDIIPLLHAPYGTAYFRGPDGRFQKEELAAH